MTCLVGLVDPADETGIHPTDSRKTTPNSRTYVVMLSQRDANYTVNEMIMDFTKILDSMILIVVEKKTEGIV